MEAKDTVMNTKVNWIAFNQASLEKLLLEQAEISCKAGQTSRTKEIVEWLGLHQAESTREFIVYCMSAEGWQAKLKEWGL